MEIKNLDAFPSNVSIMNYVEENYGYLVLRKYVTKYNQSINIENIIKFKSSEAIDIVRVELEYQ